MTETTGFATGYEQFSAQPAVKETGLTDTRAEIQVGTTAGGNTAKSDAPLTEIIDGSRHRCQGTV
jgi:hypothetical protein